jgi:hypothetical protein
MLISLKDNGYYSLIDRVNERMRFAGIGYKHDGNFIHRVEDEIFDEEITQKTLGIALPDFRTENLKFSLDFFS